MKTSSTTNIITISQLSEQDFEACIDILQTIQGNLKKEEKHFIKPKSLSQLFDLARNGASILGAKNQDGQIVGLMIAEPNGVPSIVPVFSMAVDIAPRPEQALLQSVCVDPAYSGRGILQSLFKETEKWATENNITSLIAKISKANFGSQKNFLRNGFNDAGHSCVDPIAGYPCTIMQKELSPLALEVILPSNTGDERTPIAA